MPDPIKLGDTGVKIVDVQRDWHPQYGPSTTFIWEGEEEALNTMAPNMGGVARVYRFNGPVYRMNVRYGDAQDGSTEVPSDTWEIDTEMAEVSLWECPILVKLAGGSDELLIWKSFILTAAEAKLDPPGHYPNDNAPWTGDLAATYREYLRGTRAFELKRPILKRIRTISTNYANPVDIIVPEPVYTSNKLKDLYGIPVRIFAQLPDNPSADVTPTDRFWGWKQRKESSKTVIALNKTEETIEWIFAPWSRLTHTIIS